MPQVMVGKSPCKVSWAEWHLIIMPKGTPVWFAKQPGLIKTFEHGVGVFEFSSFYDGVVGHIRVGNNIVHIFPEMGDRVRKLRKLEDADFFGAGI